MIAEIATGLSGIKTALDILKGAKDLKGVAVATQIQGLQSALLDAQNGLFAASQAHAMDVERIRALEAEVRGFEEWDREKARYQLQAVRPGSFAYALKPDASSSEPPHWLCPTCYQQRKKSLLQKGEFDAGSYGYLWACPSCKTAIKVGSDFGPHNPWTVGTSI
jgi:rubredoxin